MLSNFSFQAVHKHCSKVVVVEGLKQSEWGLYEATTATAKAMATETVNEE